MLCEMEDFKAKIEGLPLMKWLLGLPDFPRVMESADPGDARTSLLGRCRQFVKIGRGGKSAWPGSPRMRTAYRDLVEGKGQKKAKEKPPLLKHIQGLLPWLSEMVEGKPPHEIQDQGRQKE